MGFTVASVGYGEKFLHTDGKTTLEIVDVDVDNNENEVLITHSNGQVQFDHYDTDELCALLSAEYQSQIK